MTTYRHGNVQKQGKVNAPTASAISLNSREPVPALAEEMTDDHPYVAQDAVRSSQFLGAKSSFGDVEEHESATEDENITTAQYWQSMNDRFFEESYRRSASIVERAIFDEISNVFYPDHWMIAPFVPGKSQKFAMLRESTVSLSAGI